MSKLRSETRRSLRSTQDCRRSSSRTLSISQLRMFSSTLWCPPRQASSMFPESIKTNPKKEFLKGLRRNCLLDWLDIQAKKHQQSPMSMRVVAYSVERSFTQSKSQCQTSARRRTMDQSHSQDSTPTSQVTRPEQQTS